MLSLWFVFTWGERLMLVLASLVKTRLYGGNLINGETRLICHFWFFSLPHQRSTTVSLGTEPFIRFRCGLVVWPLELRFGFAFEGSPASCVSLLRYQPEGLVQCKPQDNQVVFVYLC